MKLTPTEHQQQCLIFEWAELNKNRYPELNLMFAIPNGSHKSITQAVKFKREGLKSGVPDIFLPHAVSPFHGLFIELKAKDGKLTKNQKNWILNLKSQGYFATVCVGSESAISVIKSYLKGEVVV
jgi:uncharacterized protein YcgL (UPF0745 family)